MNNVSESAVSLIMCFLLFAVKQYILYFFINLFWFFGSIVYDFFFCRIRFFIYIYMSFSEFQSRYIFVFVEWIFVVLFLIVLYIDIECERTHRHARGWGGGAGDKKRRGTHSWRGGLVRIQFTHADRQRDWWEPRGMLGNATPNDIGRDDATGFWYRFSNQIPEGREPANLVATITLEREREKCVSLPCPNGETHELGRRRTSNDNWRRLRRRSHCTKCVRARD